MRKQIYKKKDTINYYIFHLLDQKYAVFEFMKKDICVYKIYNTYYIYHIF